MEESKWIKIGTDVFDDENNCNEYRRGYIDGCLSTQGKKCDLFNLMSKLAEMSEIVVKANAERKRAERKYNRYYHLVEDFYAYLLKINKIKEFTLFHEENEIKREAESDG